jgi:hypothetical protein
MNQEDMQLQLGSIVLEEILRIQASIDASEQNLRRMARIIDVNRRVLPDFVSRMTPDNEISDADLRAYVDDIHRAMIVFTHSTLEAAVCDVVRILLNLRLTVAPEEVFSLLGQNKKYSIQELKAKKDKTVDQIIEEHFADGSALIERCLSNRSFNDKDAIIDQLNTLGISIRSLHRQLEQLNEMMQRRHQVVHKADYMGEGKTRQLNTINYATVVEWTTHLMDFIHGLFKETLLSETLARDIVRKAEQHGVSTTIEVVKKTIRKFLNEETLNTPPSQAGQAAQR